jgi:hypothetical protein
MVGRSHGRFCAQNDLIYTDDPGCFYQNCNTTNLSEPIWLIFTIRYSSRIWSEYWNRIQ